MSLLLAVVLTRESALITALNSADAEPRRGVCGRGGSAGISVQASRSSEVFCGLGRGFPGQLQACSDVRAETKGRAEGAPTPSTLCPHDCPAEAFDLELQVQSRARGADTRRSNSHRY